LHQTASHWLYTHVVEKDFRLKLEYLCVWLYRTL
jgi:hypothetical protein